MLSALAEFERNRISERIRDSFEARRANNIAILSGGPAYGFAFEGKGKNRRLVPDPREQEILGTMRRLYSEGHTYIEIARWLNEAGYHSRTGTAIANGPIRRLLIRQNLAPQHLDKKTVRLRQRQGIDEALRDWTAVKNWLDPLKPTQEKRQQRRAEADRASLRVINRIRVTGITMYSGIADKLTAANIPAQTGRSTEWGAPAVRKIMLRLGLVSSRRPNWECPLQLGSAPPITDAAVIALIQTDRQTALAEMRRVRDGGASFQAIAVQMRKYGCPVWVSADAVLQALKRSRS
jgi:hypothetical protein